MDIVERIFALVQEKNIEQKEFAALIGIAPSKVSEWKNGKAKSYTKYIPRIAEALNTTTEYLLTGNGPRTKTPVAVSEMDTISPEEQRLLTAYRSADERTKELVRLALEPFGLSASSDEAM